jgi:hypothetical protein
MEELKIVWSVIFFFFMLILIFTWSKIVVISNRIKKVILLIDKFDQIYSDNNEVDDLSTKE